MPIKFACPHCKRMLSVKDELAGKRGACPGCKKLVSIPTSPTPAAGKSASGTSASSTVDLESLAVAALGSTASDEPAAPSQVDFACPHCDAELHLSAELAGKQSPCPECRRIIKVPLLIKTGPRDWRRTDGQQIPTGAKVDTAGMESAWGTQTTRSTSSKQALIEAGLLPAKTLTPLRRWLTIGGTAAGLLIVVGGGIWAWLAYSNRDREHDGVVNAEKWLRDGGGDPSQRAELVRLMAEYYQRSDTTDSQGRDASGRFKIAVDQAAGISDAEARLSALRKCIRSLVEFKQYQNLEEALRYVKERRARELVYRELAMMLVSAGEGERLERLIKLQVPAVFPGSEVPLPAPGTAPGSRVRPDHTPDADASEQIAYLSIVGQAYLAAGSEARAKAIAKHCRESYRPAHDCPPQFIALVIQLGEKEPEGPKEGTPEHAAFQLALKRGRAEGHLRAGRFDEAAKYLAELQSEPIPFLETVLVFAQVRPETEVPFTPIPKENVDPAKEPIMAARFKLRSITDASSVAWHRRRLVEVCVQVGHLDIAKGLLGQPDYVSADAADRIRLEILRRRLAGETGYVDPADLRGGFTAGSLGDAAACACIARHNARHDPSATAAWAEKLDHETARAFAGIGISIGMNWK